METRNSKSTKRAEVFSEVTHVQHPDRVGYCRVIHLNLEHSVLLGEVDGSPVFGGSNGDVVIFSPQYPIQAHTDRRTSLEPIPDLEIFRKGPQMVSILNRVNRGLNTYEVLWDCLEREWRLLNRENTAANGAYWRVLWPRCTSEGVVLEKPRTEVHRAPQSGTTTDWLPGMVEVAMREEGTDEEIGADLAPLPEDTPADTSREKLPSWDEVGGVQRLDNQNTPSVNKLGLGQTWIDSERNE